MAQLTYRSGSFITAGNASGGDLTVTKPTGTADGDLIVIAAYFEPDTTTISLTGGFSTGREQVNTGAFKLQVFWKIAASEPASYTLSNSTAGNQWRAAVGAAYTSGTGSGERVDIAGSSQADGVAGTSQTAPSVTTTGTNRLLVYSNGNYAGTEATGVFGTASSFRGSFGSVVIADVARASAGATGTTYPDGTGTQDYVGIHVAFISDIAAATSPFTTRYTPREPSFKRETTSGAPGTRLALLIGAESFPTGESAVSSPLRLPLASQSFVANLATTLLAEAPAAAPFIPPVWDRVGAASVRLVEPGAGVWLGHLYPIPADTTSRAYADLPGRLVGRLTDRTDNLLATTLLPTVAADPFVPPVWDRVMAGPARLITRTTTRPSDSPTFPADTTTRLYADLPRRLASLLLDRADNLLTTTLAAVAPADAPFVPNVWALPRQAARPDVSFRDFYLLDDTVPFTARVQVATALWRQPFRLLDAPINRLPLTETVVAANPFFGAMLGTVWPRPVSPWLSIPQNARPFDPVPPVGGIWEIPAAGRRADTATGLSSRVLLEETAAAPFVTPLWTAPHTARLLPLSWRYDSLREDVPFFVQTLGPLPVRRPQPAPWTAFWPNLHATTLYEPPPPPGSATGPWAGLSGASGTSTIVPWAPTWRGWR